LINWFYLLIAIVAEVIATSTLPATQSFTKLIPSVVVIAGYCSAIYFLTLTLKAMPVGVAYAVWCGVGVALVALIGWLVLGQKLDTAAVIGLLLIVSGVLTIYLFSSNAPQ